MRLRSFVFATWATLWVSSGVALAQTCSQPGAIDEVVQRRDGRLWLTLFLKDSPPNDWATRVRAVLKDKAPEFEQIYKPPAAGQVKSKPWLYVQLVTEAAKLPKTDARYLDFKGRTLTAAERDVIVAPKAVLALSFGFPKGGFPRDFARANDVGAAIAESLGALLSDDDTREYFSPQSWRALRVKDTGGDLVVSQHFTVHLYRKDEYLRAVTLGLAKFGLPELAVHEMASSENRPVGFLINLVAQGLYERDTRVAKGRLDVALQALKPTPWVQELRGGLGPKATGAAPLCLYDVKPEPGDADNRLLRIGFELSDGPDRHARRHAFLSGFFGLERSDVINARTGDAELLAASERARQRLPQLKADFQKGLRPGERLMIKSGYSANGNTEYMWMEVARWDAAGIGGVLMSEPRYVKSLRAGQEVVVREADVYDYLRQLPDGKTEGNETTAILQRRAGGR